MGKLIGSVIFAIIAFGLSTASNIYFDDISLQDLSITGSIVKFLGLCVWGYLLQVINFDKNKKS